MVMPIYTKCFYVQKKWDEQEEFSFKCINKSLIPLNYIFTNATSSAVLTAQYIEKCLERNYLTTFCHSDLVEES